MKKPLIHRHALLAAVCVSSMVPRTHGAEFTVTSAADSGGTAESSETINPDGTRTVDVKDSQPISANPKRFLRVRVESATLPIR
jgi:hypothetical protein